MYISQLIAACLRAIEFTCAIIVIGCDGTLLNIQYTYGRGPNGRLLYTISIAIFAALTSFIWIWPCTWRIPHYPLDILISLMWFASFGALTNWIHRINCQRAYNFSGRYYPWLCDTYRTNEAFVIISGALWLFSSFLSCYVFHTRNKVTKSNRYSVKVVKDPA